MPMPSIAASGARPRSFRFRDAALPHDVEAFAPGQTVRLRRQPAAGSIATIMSLPSSTAVFPSGLRAPAAEVRLENGEQLLIPLVNLEVVG
jgi:hypothetical protein